MPIDPRIPLGIQPDRSGRIIAGGIQDILNRRDQRKQQEAVNERQNRLIQLQENQFQQQKLKFQAEQEKLAEDGIRKSVGTEWQNSLRGLYENKDYDTITSILEGKASEFDPRSREGVAWGAILEGHLKDPETAAANFRQVTRQAEFDQLIPGAPKGKRINAQDKSGGAIFPAIETSEGRLKDPATGKLLPNAIKAPSRQETGEPGSLTKSQEGKITAGSIGAEQAVSKHVLGVENVIDIVARDDFVGGASGRVVSAINSAGAQARQLTGQAGILDENGKIDESQLEVSEENMDFIRRAAISSDEFESAIIELAYIKAKNVDPNSKITDKDFDFARRMLVSGADKASIITLLRSNQKRAIQNYNSDTRVVNKRTGRNDPMISMGSILGREVETPESDQNMSDKLIEDFESQFNAP